MNDLKQRELLPETAPPSAERPPFKEISVFFPLLTFYTAGYLGLMAAEFVLQGVFTLPAGFVDPGLIRRAGERKGNFYISGSEAGDQKSE